MLSETIYYFLAQTTDPHYHSRAAQTRWVENILNCHYEHITNDKASQKLWNSQYFVSDNVFIVEAGRAFIYSWIKTIKLLAFLLQNIEGILYTYVGVGRTKNFCTFVTAANI